MMPDVKLVRYVSSPGLVAICHRLFPLRTSHHLQHLQWRTPPPEIRCTDTQFSCLSLLKEASIWDPYMVPSPNKQLSYMTTQQQ